MSIKELPRAVKSAGKGIYLGKVSKEDEAKNKGKHLLLLQGNSSIFYYRFETTTQTTAQKGVKRAKSGSENPGEAKDQGDEASNFFEIRKQVWGEIFDLEPLTKNRVACLLAKGCLAVYHYDPNPIEIPKNGENGKTAEKRKPKSELTHKVDLKFHKQHREVWCMLLVTKDEKYFICHSLKHGTHQASRLALVSFDGINLTIRHLLDLSPETKFFKSMVNVGSAGSTYVFLGAGYDVEETELRLFRIRDGKIREDQKLARNIEAPCLMNLEVFDGGKIVAVDAYGNLVEVSYY